MPRRSIRVVAGGALAALLVAGAPPASGPALAQPGSSSYTWQNVQIYGGGFMPGIIYNETEPGLVYARADIGGAYRMDPGTGRWVPLLDWLGWDHWSWTGVESLATDPADPDRLYLAVGTYTNDWDPNNGAILRSTDRGDSFEITELPFKIGGNMHGRSMGERLAIDPNQNSILYLGSSRDGLWRSTDFGATWSQVGNFPNPGNYVRDPDDPFGYHSQPTGIVWVTFDPSSGTPGSPTGRIFAGVADEDGTTVYRTTNAGASWELVPGQPTDFCCPHKGKLDHANGLLYVTYGNTPGPYDASKGDVWRHDLATGDWTRISPVPSESDDNYYGYGGFAIDRQNPDTVMVSSFTSWWPDEQIWRSNDNGDTWSPIWEWTRYPNRDFRYTMDISEAPWLSTLGPPPGGGRDPVQNPKLGWMMGDLEIDPHDSDRMMYVTGATVYGSDNLTQWDAGQQITITVKAAGIEETSISALVSPPSGAHLVSGIYDIFGARHDDLDTPPDRTHGEPWFATHDLDFAELNPSVMFRVGKHLFVDPGASPNQAPKMSAYSTDGGTTWTAIRNNVPGMSDDTSAGGGSVAVSANGDVFVWAPDPDPVSGDLAVHWSNNRRNWNASQGIPPGAKVAADRVNPNRFYGFKDGVSYVSTDGARTFTPTATSGLPTVGRTNLKAVPGFEGHVWLSGGAEGNAYGIWHSDDGGVTFTQLSSVDEGDTIGFGMAAPGQSYPALYTSSKIGGVRGIFRSDDAGATWVRVNDDQHQWAWTGETISGDPRIYGRVYVGTNGRGIIYGDITS